MPHPSLVYIRGDWLTRCDWLKLPMPPFSALGRACVRVDKEGGDVGGLDVNHALRLRPYRLQIGGSHVAWNGARGHGYMR